VTEEDMANLLSVDCEGWLKEVADIRANHYPKFGDKLPAELAGMLDVMEKNLSDCKSSSCC
jgi:phosphoenolpyruvate carboxykinase (GTP)